MSNSSGRTKNDWPVGIGSAKTRIFRSRFSSWPDGGRSSHPAAGCKSGNLARMIGLSRETTSRLLSRLKAGKILYWTHSTGVIQNLPALRKWPKPGSAKCPRNATRSRPACSELPPFCRRECDLSHSQNQSSVIRRCWRESPAGEGSMWRTTRCGLREVACSAQLDFLSR